MTAITIGNIGRVLHLEGKLDASREWLQQALEIDESAHGRDHPDVATDLNRLGEVQLAQGDLPGARDSLIRSLAIRQRTPSSFGEGINFFLLSLVAKEMGRVEAGLRLLATQYVVDTLIAHPSAEAKDLPHLRAMAATLGYDEAWLQALLSEVDAAYNQDRGQGLVAEAFPEIDDE